MIIAFPAEQAPGENRVALIPATASKLVALGAVVRIEGGLGASIRFADATYAEAGAEVVADRQALLAEADMVVRIRKPADDEIGQLRQGAVQISYLDPFREGELVEKLAAHGVNAISLEMIPRTTLAQKMDALSSQASLAGYAAVITAAERLDRVLPMMMTPAGTLTPANVFVLGAGVAGLQAIATAKRLGARVTAFDIRPASETEVISLGAKFLKIDLGETGQTEQGYAKELTPEQLAKQKEGQAKQCEQSDIVITTAQVFGRPAPRLIERSVIERMKPGSVIIDMAAESGGNVEGSKPGEEVEVDGVRIIGVANLPGQVASHASQMLASNVFNLIEHLWDEEQNAATLDLQDPIVKGCLLTHAGAIVNERLTASRQGA